MKEKHVILVVDDQANNRKLLADLLSAKGYEVATAAGGQEALAKVEDVRPDLVLLDIMMPDLSGYDVCKRIRAQPSYGVLPVVMVTALDPAQERVKGLEAGADDFLTKPINQPELLARVNSLLRIKKLYDTVQQQAGQLSELNAGLERRVNEQVGQLQRLNQLKRFFAPQLAELIVAGEFDDPLKTRRREVTVAILDLRGFTAFADSSEPEEVMGLLRAYHGEMGRMIQSYEGTLEQFTPESMMVIFNDPVMVENPAERAVRMAIDMQACFAELMVGWRKRGHDIALGIGIAHGYATIGAIGFEARKGYGVIGRVTNLARRLCTEAQAGQILIGQSVHALVEHLVEVDDIGPVQFAGFTRPLATFSVGRLRPGVLSSAALQNSKLKIFTLGQFSILREGKAPEFGRRAQKKPLDLLRALIAAGGERVDASALTAQLWPDAEGDAGKVSFDSNLYRLRKLIGADDVLAIVEGKLSLDSSQCWIDVWEFDELVNRIDQESHKSTGDRQLYVACAKDLPRLYAGHFLDKESQEPWAIAARDKFKAKFLRCVGILGAYFEREKEWGEAIALYARALELDNLAEALYRRLMICHRENGDPAEALNVYRRCKDMLSIVLNLKPSPETEAIRAGLG